MQLLKDYLEKKGILQIQFNDSQLVMIAKVYQDITNQKRNPQKLTQQQINKVVNYIMHQHIAKIQEAEEKEKE